MQEYYACPMHFIITCSHIGFPSWSVSIRALCRHPQGCHLCSPLSDSRPRQLQLCKQHRRWWIKISACMHMLVNPSAHALHMAKLSLKWLRSHLFELESLNVPMVKMSLDVAVSVLLHLATIQPFAMPRLHKQQNISILQCNDVNGDALTFCSTRGLRMGTLQLWSSGFISCATTFLKITNDVCLHEQRVQRCLSIGLMPLQSSICS